MIIKEMFYIPIKLKPELARASMTTADVNNQWRCNFQQQIIYHKKNSQQKFNYIKFWCDLNVIIRIECISLQFYRRVKAWTETHFLYEVRNVLQSTFNVKRQ
jgi:hypothetical protein